MMRISSSRETIAAGTSPPRVMQTIGRERPRLGKPPGERPRVAMELVPRNRKSLFGLGRFRSPLSMRYDPTPAPHPLTLHASYASSIADLQRLVHRRLSPPRAPPRRASAAPAAS